MLGRPGVTPVLLLRAVSQPSHAGGHVACSGDPSLRHSDVLYGARLKMVGGCRNEDDRRRLEELKQHAAQLGVAESVDWCAAWRGLRVWGAPGLGF